MVSCFNPAGIFSTDDHQMDQSQLMAEQGEEEYRTEEEPLYPTEPEDFRLICIYCGCCSCTFWERVLVPDFSELIKKQSTEWRRSHAANCEDELIIGTF